jgi:prepilin-type processing-associated H-X9-DG protein
MRRGQVKCLNPDRSRYPILYLSPFRRFLSLPRLLYRLTCPKRKTADRRRADIKKKARHGDRSNVLTLDGDGLPRSDLSLFHRVLRTPMWRRCRGEDVAGTGRMFQIRTRIGQPISDRKRLTNRRAIVWADFDLCLICRSQAQAVRLCKGKTPQLFSEKWKIYVIWRRTTPP